MYPDPEKKRNRGYLGYDSSALPPRDRLDRQQLRYELDLNSWNLRIWGVAASGFLTDSCVAINDNSNLQCFPPFSVFLLLLLAHSGFVPSPADTAASCRCRCRCRYQVQPVRHQCHPLDRLVRLLPPRTMDRSDHQPLHPHRVGPCPRPGTPRCCGRDCFSFLLPADTSSSCPGPCWASCSSASSLIGTGGPVSTASSSCWSLCPPSASPPRAMATATCPSCPSSSGYVSSLEDHHHLLLL